MRRLLPFVMLSVALCIFSRPARAAFESESPDGTPISRDNLPSELALRPLVAPKGLLSAELSYNQAFGLTQTQPFVLTAGAGLGNGLALVLGASFWRRNGGSITLEEQFARFFALSLEGGYERWLEPHYEVPLDCPSGSKCGPRQVGNIKMSQLYGTLRGRFKFLLPHLPLALRVDGALYARRMRGTLGQSFAPGVGKYAVSPVLVRGQLWLEFSPLRFLTLSAGVQGYEWIDEIVGLDDAIRYFGSVNGTLPWFDVGCGVEQYRYFRPEADSLTEVWVYVAPRWWW